jgi:serine kinase of HPr protein (carbohydrate metabolism regulator)
VIRGEPGAGKSDLALRLIDDGARLVADDQVVLVRQGARILASAPPAIAGRMEVRGLGIVAVQGAGPTAVALVVDLAPGARIARLPEAGEQVAELLGLVVPRALIDPSSPAAPARLRAALAHLGTLDHAPAAALVSPAEE